MCTSFICHQHLLHRFTNTSFIKEKLIPLLALIWMSSVCATAQNNMASSHRSVTLHAEFNRSVITVDGKKENAWLEAPGAKVGIAMTSNLSATDPQCQTYGEVHSLWDGALLYLLIEVSDADITNAGKRATDKDAVEIYLDLRNDKFPKYEEDDGVIRISSSGEITSTGSPAERVEAFATTSRYNKEKQVTGYIVELALHTGGLSIQNGTAIGIEFGIIDATSDTHAAKHRIFWSDGNNKGVNDNTKWGTLILNGYDDKNPFALDTFSLHSSIKKAEALPRGVWNDETKLDQALAAARQSITATDQTQINAAALSLENAITNLRRKGKYPDPFDLPSITHLPDPFTFTDGRKVKSAEDWVARRKEIRNLAQYYEYGFMPDPPDSVAATINGKTLTVRVTDNRKTESFDALLTIPTVEQCGKAGPYPVIVSIDFREGDARQVYLEAGYAVLSVIYSRIASDNFDHHGPFYSLYPYDVNTGNDAGTLLAWAWGASRGVDARTYLVNNNPSFANRLDLDKLVVTGFSRCGKAALLAGLMDERFDVVSPGASGCGGAAVYRYDSFGNTPFRKAPFGNVYDWGTSPGAEVLPDKLRHQGHNSDQMLSRFLNPDRLYKTNTHGYGERLPYDHHEIIAAIAPRAVLITTANDDYANNAEGDCIGLEGAKPVFEFLGARQNLALNLRTSGEPNPRGWGGGHWISETQLKNLVAFSNMIFFGSSLPQHLEEKFYTNPYLPTFDKYYGGTTRMMPWLSTVPASEK